MKGIARMALGISLLLATSISCWERKNSDPDIERAEDIEETREQGMEKHREWSGSQEMERDTAQRDTSQRQSGPKGVDSIGAPGNPGGSH